MLRALARLLKVLNSESDPSQVSLAFCFAMVAGLTPLMSLHNLLILLLVLILKVNLSAFILGFLLFSGVACLLDPLFHLLGLSVLTAASLEGLWTTLYNLPLFRLENFNNSIMMGSLLFSISLFIPLYLITKWLIVNYREHLLAWVKKFKLIQMLEASKLYKIYTSLSGGGRGDDL
jgi:uncharacterized protein (TIGR03546 family)